MSLGFTDHQIIGSSLEYHGNIPFVYALISLEGVKSPPQATIPSSFAS